MKQKTVPQLLNQSAKTYAERNAVYGDTYKMHGDVVQALFPDGIEIDNKDDHNRFAILTMIIGKLTRYSVNFYEGGHQDSIHDISVYAAMLEELDNEQ